MQGVKFRYLCLMFHNVIKLNMYRKYRKWLTVGWGTLPIIQFLYLKELQIIANRWKPKLMKCAKNSFSFILMIVMSVEKSTVKFFHHKKSNFLERFF